MMVDIVGNGWIADVRISDNLQQEWIHVEASVRADSHVLALTGANWVMDNFGKGRTCAIRVPPEADAYRDFDAKKNIFKGYVRFSWENAPLHWHQPDPNPRLSIAGLP